MGRSGTPADNAVAESFFATLQTELLDRYDWPTRDGLRTAIFEFIEVFYNRPRPLIRVVTGAGPVHSKQDATGGAWWRRGSGA